MAHTHQHDLVGGSGGNDEKLLQSRKAIANLGIASHEGNEGFWSKRTWTRAMMWSRGWSSILLSGQLKTTLTLTWSFMIGWFVDICWYLVIFEDLIDITIIVNVLFQKAKNAQAKRSVFANCCAEKLRESENINFNHCLFMFAPQRNMSRSKWKKKTSSLWPCSLCCKTSPGWIFQNYFFDSHSVPVEKSN